jgi:hypothetical protein
MLCALAPPVGGEGPANEYSLKAAFVYQFPQFVDWPAAAWEGAPHVELCVPRPHPIGPEVALLARGESLHGRPYTVREVEPGDSITSCHVLFVAATPARSVAERLRAAAARPVLTVGEGDGFLESGGIIRLRVVDRRIRFDVDVVNAQRAGLRISSQLLNLAQSIRGGGP